MYRGRSSVPIVLNFSYPHQTSGMNTLLPPAFGERHQSNSSGPLHPLFNPGQQMYPGHQIQNHGFGVNPSSVGYNVPLFYPGISDVNTLVPPSLGQPENENSYGQLQPGVNPGYQMNPLENPDGYQMQQIQHDSDFRQNPATGGVVPYDYDSMQHQVMINDPLNQPPAQDPSHQVEEERDAEEEVMVVEVDQPLLPTGRARLRWTPELHRRFSGAAEELGGYFKATPKKLLERMNVRGITHDQLKSRLQKMRTKVSNMNPSAAKKNMGPGNEDNTNIDAQQSVEENETYFDIMPNPELHSSYEAANNSQNHTTVPMENPPCGLELEHFNLQSTPQNMNNNADNGFSLMKDPVGDLNYQDFEFPAISPIEHDSADVGKAPMEDLSSDFKLSDFDWVPIDNKDFGFASFEDPVSYLMLNNQQRPYHNPILSALAVDNAQEKEIEFKDSDFSLATSRN